MSTSSQFLSLILKSTQAFPSAISTRRAPNVRQYSHQVSLRPLSLTYLHFLTDNAPRDDDVWHSRLRLLQLLGGAHDYDAAVIKARLAQLPEELLVPETIILSGRDKAHDVALRLLVHQLGDYDSAVSYCLMPQLTSPSAKLANSKYNKEEDFAAMIKGFEWATKRRFKSAADKSYIKFGRIGDSDKSFGISAGQMSLTGCV